MAEDLQATGPVEVDESPQRRRVWRGPWRSVILPLVVVGAIAGAIWWLGYRPDAGSSPHRPRAPRGRGVILNFGAAGAPPCRKEMPQFVAAYDQYRGEGLEVVAVNVQESPSIIRPFVDDFGMKFPVVLDKRSSVSDSYRLSGLPMTYFIDREGVLRSAFPGPV